MLDLNWFIEGRCSRKEEPLFGIDDTSKNGLIITFCIDKIHLLRLCQLYLTVNY